MCLVCLCGGACRSVYWCAGAPNFSRSFFFVLSVCCCCCCIMSSVSHRPPSCQALNFAVATLQQLSHSKMVWTTTYVLRMCVMCVLWADVQVYASLWIYLRAGASQFSLVLLYFVCLLLLPSHAVCITLCLTFSSSYFVAAMVQQQLHRNFVWTTFMRMLALRMRV